MAGDLEAISERALAAAKAAGAAEADALVLRGTALEIAVREGALEQCERQEGTEIGLRVILDGRQACVSSSDTRPEAIATMAERAVAMARVAPRDPHAGLATPEQLATSWDVAALELADPAEEPAPGRLEEAAHSAEVAARAVKGVTRVATASAGYSRREVALAASNGFAGSYTRTSSGMSAVAIAGEGTRMERDYAFESRVFAADLPRAEEVGTLAGERAVAMFGARRPPTGHFPVVFDERVAAGVIGHLLQAVNGTAVARGASWLRNALGAEVLPSALSLIEEPLRPRMSASRPFDVEGLPTATRRIVDAGRLTGWTLDLSTARRMGMASTANAARSPTSPPSPGNFNVTLSPGNLSREALIAETGTGLLVTSLIGSTINPTTGDYSRGASGFWIEGGQIAYPVNECTIAGNLREMLMTLAPANDAQAHKSHRVPSLRIDGLTLAGA